MFIDYEEYIQKNNYWWYIVDAIILIFSFLFTKLGFIAVYYRFNQSFNYIKLGKIQK